MISSTIMDMIDSIMTTQSITMINKIVQIHTDNNLMRNITIMKDSICIAKATMIPQIGTRSTHINSLTRICTHNPIKFNLVTYMEKEFTNRTHLNKIRNMSIKATEIIKKILAIFSTILWFTISSNKKYTIIQILDMKNTTTRILILLIVILKIQ
jgi:hypothetical protein